MSAHACPQCGQVCQCDEPAPSARGAVNGAPFASGLSPAPWICWHECVGEVRAIDFPVLPELDLGSLPRAMRPR